MTGANLAVLSLDTREAGGFGDLKSSWGPRIGELYAMPSFSPQTRVDFRAKLDAVRLHDLVFNSIEARTGLRTAGFASTKDFARLWVVRRGAWLFSDDRGSQQRVAAGELLVQLGPVPQFAAEPGTATDFLVLPTESLGARSNPLSSTTKLGSAASAEARLLLAHATTIRDCAGELSPAGLLAARNTLIELMRALISGGVDGGDAHLAPALVHAARMLVGQWLTRPDLSTSALARELNVSLRTLQRAFAAEGQTVASYVREQRLEQARGELARPSNQLSISEIAARWQFADTSHFTRQFRRRYGMTPSEFRSSPYLYDRESRTAW